MLRKKYFTAASCAAASRRPQVEQHVGGDRDQLQAHEQQHQVARRGDEHHAGDGQQQRADVLGRAGPSSGREVDSTSSPPRGQGQPADVLGQRVDRQRARADRGVARRRRQQGQGGHAHPAQRDQLHAAARLRRTPRRCRSPPPRPPARSRASAAVRSQWTTRVNSPVEVGPWHAVRRGSRWLRSDTVAALAS